MAMRAFTEGAIVLGILLGCAIRLRIYLGSPLRPSHPLLWGLGSLAPDLTLFSLAGALALLSAHFIWQRRSWSVLTAFILRLATLHLVWSEVVVFFGHAVRARDLQVGLRPVLLLRSVRLTMFVTFAGAILISWILIRLTARRARKKGKAWVTAPRLALVAVGALAASAVPLKGYETRPVFIWSRDAETVTVINRSHVYHGRVATGGSFTDLSFLHETLIDPVADPEGARNRITAEPRAAEDLRRAARVYLQIFPWLAVQGRTGVDPGLRGRSPAVPRVTPVVGRRLVDSSTTMPRTGSRVRPGLP